MSDTVPGFVYSEDLIRQAARVEKEAAQRARRYRRSAFGWRLYSALTTLLVVLLAGALNYAVPMIRLQPVLLYTTPEGMTGAALTTDSLPGDLPTTSLQAWLWQYVQHREGYSWIEADLNHYVVEAMSSEQVRSAYEAWSSGKNPQSYQSVYHDDAVIRVSWVETTQWVPALKTSPGTVTFHFKRELVRKANPKFPEIRDYSITLRFLTNYPTGITTHDMLTFNPSRIVIVDYPGAAEMTPVRTVQ